VTSGASAGETLQFFGSKARAKRKLLLFAQPWEWERLSQKIHYFAFLSHQ
jgi:hypothetical protein